jgi:hypothetical protein
MRFERLILLLLSSGIRTASGKEESVTNPEWDEGDEDTRRALSEASDQQLASLAPSLGAGKATYDVNVAGARIIRTKRRIREHRHAEFIICTKRPGKEDVYVGRRYGTFRRLYRDVCSPCDIPELIVVVARRISRERYPPGSR